MRTPAPQLRPPGEILVLPSRADGRASDSQLVERALDGESWAFEAIYRRHVGIVAGTVRRMLRNVTETEDVVQDTFLLAFQRLAQLADGEALRVWLVRIGVSQAHRRFRRRRIVSWLTGEKAETSLAEQASPELDPAEKAELALLDRALACIAPERRTAWILRQVVGYPVEEIADILACSPATVKRRVAEVEEKVQKHLQRNREGGAA